MMYEELVKRLRADSFVCNSCIEKRRCKNEDHICVLKNQLQAAEVIEDLELVSRSQQAACNQLAEEIEKLQSELEHLKNCRHECKIDCLLKEYNKKCNELEQVKAEMGEAVRDMEAIMWVSGEGCQICKHCIEIHKEPYVQYACKIESRGCDPKWRGVQGGKDD